MTTAIRIDGLGKRYRLGATHVGSVREMANRAVGRLLGRSSAGDAQEPSDFWALDDVSFEVPAGEAIGIVGRNGAGKSTLLKILSRITPPTNGRVELSGRVASLLEVGTGFHPELTGRENVLLNGTILGMTRAEVLRKFDSIVQFAGVEQFIDTPVKRYSSGMTVRLGFAVAAHLDPEILIVDEVLAVGDLEFQQRCLGKMNEVAHSGRTVLFVSHNLASIRQLTTKCALLSRGRLEFHGDTSEALSRYVRGGRSSELGTVYDVSNTERPFGGLSRELEFLRLTLIDNEQGDFLDNGRLTFSVRMRARTTIEGFRLGMTIFRDDQTAVGSCFSPVMGPVEAGAEIELHLAVDDLPLADGEFYCALSAGQARTSQQWELFDSVSEVLRFRVTQGSAGNGFQMWSPGWGPVKLPVMELVSMADDLSSVLEPVDGSVRR